MLARKRLRSHPTPTRQALLCYHLSNGLWSRKMKVPAMMTLLTLMICTAALQAQVPLMSSGGARGEDALDVSTTPPAVLPAPPDNAACRVEDASKRPK